MSERAAAAAAVFSLAGLAWAEEKERSSGARGISADMYFLGGRLSWVEQKPEAGGDFPQEDSLSLEKERRNYANLPFNCTTAPPRLGSLVSLP